MVWGPLCGECQEFHDIYIQDKFVTPKINAWASTPIPHPHVVSLQCLEWREVGMKLSWLVISFKPHQCDQYLYHQNADIDFYTPPIPLHWTFHPLSGKEALGNVHMNTQSFLFTYPSGVSSVWCWTSNGKFTLSGTYSVHFPLEFVPLE